MGDSSDGRREAPGVATTRRTRALLRERARTAAQPEQQPSSFAAVIGRADVGAHLREHRLDARTQRPFVAASVVLAEDGREALHAHVPAVIGEAEAVETALRDEADAVLVGAGALRSGRFERPLADRARRSLRRGRGLTLDPIGIVVSHGKCDVSALIRAPVPTTPILLYTDAPDPLPAPHGVQMTRMATSDLTPNAVLTHAMREHGIRTVLYEGGTQMLGALLSEGVLDELVLTTVPGIETDPEQPPVSELPGFSELASDGAWRIDAGPAVLRLHREPCAER
jgi:riboflavin biosynthesis pyrimidine reductase